MCRYKRIAVASRLAELRQRRCSYKDPRYLFYTRRVYEKVASSSKPARPSTYNILNKQPYYLPYVHIDIMVTLN